MYVIILRLLLNVNMAMEEQVGYPVFRFRRIKEWSLFSSLGPLHSPDYGVDEIDIFMLFLIIYKTYKFKQL